LLLLSDQTSYCYGLREALLDRFGFNLSYVRTEGEAIAYLKGSGLYANRTLFPIPDLFLIDTLHPDASDLQVLSWIREQPAFSNLVLAILADDNTSDLIQPAFDLGANSYLIRRDELAGLDEIMTSILEAKWLRQAQSALSEEDKWE
jgi:DNA-binding NarL/FixJ family response regulator